VTLQNGLEAASIILFIINTPDIDRRVVSDDAIRGVITLMRLHLSRHLIPALNQTGNFSSEALKKKDSPGSPPASKRRRVSDSSEAAFLHTKDIKKIYKHITSTLGLQLILMERIEGLMRMLPLDDQQILMLTSGVLPTLNIDCTLLTSSNAKESFQARQLQTTSISVLTAAFRTYPMHRDIVLEDLFPIMLSLPSGKRSLRTFPVRYSSSPSSTLEAMNTEIVGSLLSNGTEPHHIQMITALILSLVQSCVLRPSCVVEERKTGDEGNDRPVQAEKLQSGLRSSIVVADTFVRFLLKRCTKGKGDSASEYRPVLINIVEDLLLVLTIPEYPAAELLLTAFQRRLNQDLSAASPIFKTGNKQQQPPDVTYLNCALDVMGKICAVQARLLALAEEKSLEIITEVPMSNTSNSEQEIDCHCKKEHTDVLRIQCEQCNSIFHGKCVGLPDKESVPDQWFCDRCVLGRIIVREQHRTNGADGGAPWIDPIYAMRYALLSVTTHQMHLIDDDMDDPIKFHLARWIDEVDRKNSSQSGLQQKQLATSKLLEYWDSCRALKPEMLSDDGNIRVIVNLLTQTSQFFLSFRKQVEFLVKHLSDDNPQVLRKLSLKVIERVRVRFVQSTLMNGRRNRSNIFYLFCFCSV
jgi:cohesin loading factor subunit SCC2